MPGREPIVYRVALHELTKKNAEEQPDGDNQNAEDGVLEPRIVWCRFVVDGVNRSLDRDARLPFR
jgi:hypothetical protein